MFELHVSDLDVTAGSVPVSWCIDIETINKLKENNIRDPAVVLMTFPAAKDPYHHPTKKESRQVIRLTDLMAYVSFRMPGENHIYGFISALSYAETRDKYLNKEFGTYNTDVIDSVFYTDHVKFLEKRPDTCDSVSVNVPDELFGKEPSKFEKEWVNWLIKDKAVDQCDFRRRRLFAYLVQPFIMFGNLLIRMFFLLIAALIVSRKISLQPLLHPLRLDLGDATGIVSGTYLLPVLKDDKEAATGDYSNLQMSWYLIRKLWMLPFMPVFYIFYYTLLHGHHPGLGLLIVGGILVSLFAIIMFAFAISDGVFKRVWNNLADKINRWFYPEYYYINQDEIDNLICSSNKKFNSLTSLPKRKRTLRLRFLNLKSKVCKPFAG